MDIEQVYVTFNDRASQRYRKLFSEFETSVEGLDRRTDEPLFRRRTELYVGYCREQLQAIALELLSEHRTLREHDRLSQNLRSYCTDYLHRFVQEIRAL